MSTAIGSRIPRYLQVRDQLASDVFAGDLEPGALLPSEGDLAARYGVSRLTVRRALVLLKEAGVVTSRQGLGWSVVGGAPMRQPLDSLTSIDDQIVRAGRRPGRRLVAFGVETAPVHVAGILGTDLTLRISRLNLADDEPVGRNTAWVPQQLARRLSVEQVEARSLLHLLPVALASATQVITAVPASDPDARLLDVPVGSPLLRFDRTTRDTSGRAVLYSEAVYNSRRAEFTVELPLQATGG